MYNEITRLLASANRAIDAAAAAKTRTGRTRYCAAARWYYTKAGAATARKRLNAQQRARIDEALFNTWEGLYDVCEEK